MKVYSRDIIILFRDICILVFLVDDNDNNDINYKLKFSTYKKSCEMFLFTTKHRSKFINSIIITKINMLLINQNVDGMPEV